MAAFRRIRWPESAEYAARADCYIGCSCSCQGQYVVLEWTTFRCEIGCQVTDLSIYRSCTASGPWTLVADNPSGYKYYDELNAPCIGGHYYYKFALKWSCPTQMGEFDCYTDTQCPQLD